MVLLQTQYDRPPEGLQRGQYAVPKWIIAALGAALVIGALLFLAWRARRAMKAKAIDEPQPSRRR